MVITCCLSQSEGSEARLLTSSLAIGQDGLETWLTVDIGRLLLREGLSIATDLTDPAVLVLGDLPVDALVLVGQVLGALFEGAKWLVWVVFEVIRSSEIGELLEYNVIGMLQTGKDGVWSESQEGYKGRGGRRSELHLA